MRKHVEGLLLELLTYDEIKISFIIFYEVLHSWRLEREFGCRDSVVPQRGNFEEDVFELSTGREELSHVH